MKATPTFHRGFALPFAFVFLRLSGTGKGAWLWVVNTLYYTLTRHILSEMARGRIALSFDSQESPGEKARPGAQKPRATPAGSLSCENMSGWPDWTSSLPPNLWRQGEGQSLWSVELSF